MRVPQPTYSWAVHAYQEMIQWPHTKHWILSAIVYHPSPVSTASNVPTKALQQVKPGFDTTKAQMKGKETWTDNWPHLAIRAYLYLHENWLYLPGIVCVTCVINHLRTKGISIITTESLKSRKNGNPRMPILVGCVYFHDTRLPIS